MVPPLLADPGAFPPDPGAMGEGHPEAASNSARAAAARRGFRAISFRKLNLRSGVEEFCASWRDRNAARSR